MEVLYIAFADLSLKGVYLKVISTVDAMNRAGLSTKCLMISQKNYEKFDGYQYDMLNGVLNKRDAYDRIDEYIKLNYKKCPFILFRYPLSDKYLLEFMKDYGSMVVFEHNTIEEQELGLYFKYYTFRDFFYNLRHLNFNDLLQNQKIRKSEIEFGGRVLNIAKAGICVTSEIADYENKRAEKAYSKSIIGNAVLATTTNKGKAYYRRIDLDFQGVFVAGHANNWHGFDRIISGIKEYKGDVDIKIIVVGNVLESIKRMVNNLGLSNKIKFVGQCDRLQMEKYFENADLGISTLALHRIPLKQGSVLKTREYLLHGLPILIGYNDEEVERNELLQKVVIKASANDSPIDFKSIINQLNNINEQNINPNTIIKTAFDEFSIDNKARQIMRVFEELDAENLSHI